MATAFSQRAQCLIEQFGAYRAAQGTSVHVDGALTVGENIADLGGLRLAYEALFDGSPHDQRAGELDARQLFFLGYAQTHCENVRTELATTRAQTDPHAPGWLRVNGPLSNLPELATAFQCANGTPMARATRCEVW